MLDSLNTILEETKIGCNVMIPIPHVDRVLGEPNIEQSLLIKGVKKIMPGFNHDIYDNTRAMNWRCLVSFFSTYSLVFVLHPMTYISGILTT